MRKISSLALAVAVIATLAPAQQTGDADRNHYINGIGRDGTSPVGFSQPLPGPVNTSYETTAPNAPCVWGAATQSTPNWVPGLLDNSADLGPAGLTFLANALDPTSFVNQIFYTDSSGNLNFTIQAQNNLNLQTLYFSLLHFTPASADGFYTGQVIFLQFGCSSLTSEITLVDDDDYVLDLGWTASFYGATYTQVNVSSNGYVSFGSSATDFFGNSLLWDFDLVGATIAPLGTDLNPSSGGSIRVGTFSGSFDVFWVCWDEIPYFFDSGSNTFSLTFQRFGSGAGNIIFTYGNLSGTYPYRIVGLKPASGGDVMALDMTGSGSNFGANVTNGGWRLQEEFDGSNPVDLAGDVVEFTYDTAGYPFRLATWPGL